MNYPRTKLEVIIINDGGMDFSTPLLAYIEDREHIQYNWQTQQGPATARNHGANLAQGEYVAFVDDDCLPHPEWLLKMVAEKRDNEPLLIGGKVTNHLTQNVYAEASQLLVDYLYQFFNQLPQPATFFTSNNMLMPKKTFQALGGFDTQFPIAAAEDRELCERWRTAGFNLKYVPEAIIRHAHRLTFKTYCRQQFNYGMGIFYFNQKFKVLKGTNRRLESFAFYWQLIAYPFTLYGRVSAFGLSMLLTLAQVANLLGFLTAYITHGRKKATSN